MTSSSIAILRQYYSAYGGAERVVGMALEKLSKLGDLEISIIARSWPQENLGGSQFVQCDPPHVGRSMRDRGFARAAARLCRQFDLVQSHERVPGAQIFRAGSGAHAEWLRQLCRQRGVGRSMLQKISLYHRTALSLEREMLSHKNLRAVIANSPMVAEDLARHYPECRPKIRIIWNGVDLNRFSVAARMKQRHLARQMFGLKTDDKAIAMIGSDWQRKGAHCLISALAKMGKETMLLLAGKERNTKNFKRFAAHAGVSERVRFIGKTDNPLQILAAADCFALPSIYDQSPTASLEALACGLPVVLSAQCGTKSLVKEGRTGYVVDAHDHQLWPDALEAALDISPRCMRDCRSSVEHLSEDIMISQWITLYRELLAQA